MTITTSRADFEKLIDLRMFEARILLRNREWDGAYYIAGYAVEFALKVRIISELLKAEVFPDRKTAEGFFRHELTMLRRIADLDVEMDTDAAVSEQWETVKDWSEQSRYQSGRTEQEARDLYDAIENGVLPWIKARW